MSVIYGRIEERSVREHAVLRETRSFAGAQYQYTPRREPVLEKAVLNVNVHSLRKYIQNKLFMSPYSVVIQTSYL